MERDAVLRILDVNLNRAAEGLRTLEDIARVVREDASCAGWLKSLRSELAGLADQLPRSERLAARSVHSDAGTSLTSSSELKRQQWSDMVAAAAQRTTESLRVIEEVSKRDFTTLAMVAKQLRYRAYDRLAQVEIRLNELDRGFKAWPLYLLVDCSLPLSDFAKRLEILHEAGVGLFQIRDKQAEAKHLLEYCQAAAKAVGAQRIIVNDRVDVALACGAGGVHVGQEDLSLQQVQQLAKGRLWIGVSTHNLAQAKQAQSDGADYIGCGPTFASQTKQFQQFAGTEFLKEVAAEIDLPAYAIGGICQDNIQQVLQTGISRVAVSGAIWSADNPATSAQRLAGQLG